MTRLSPRSSMTSQRKMTPRPDRRLRVAHVVESFATGGLGKLLVEFARHGNGRVYAPRFVSLGSRDGLAGEIEEAGCPVEALGLSPDRRPRLAIALARLFRRERIDVV